MDTMFPEEKEIKALKQCFTQGWLHTDKILSNNQEDLTGYFFASTLHRLYLEWKLSNSNPNTAVSIQAPNLQEFVIDVIKRFSPLNLSSRYVCPHYTQTPQYQVEFYRCCYELTLGTLRTLSEFGTADGFVDFYIPSKKWAVKLLRDEQLLQQHNNHFSSTGPYGMNLPIDEYIVLDFRKKKVVKPQPRKSIPSQCFMSKLLQILSIYSMWFSMTQTRTTI